MVLRVCDITFSFSLDNALILLIIIVVIQESLSEGLYGCSLCGTNESKSFLYIINIELIINQIIMNYFKRYLNSHARTKTTAKIRKSLFYGTTIFLGGLLLSNKMNTQLYYLMLDTKANRTLNKKNK